MSAIAGLFGRTPFAPLETHMSQVTDCVRKLPELFGCLEKEDWDTLKKIADEICTLEHNADITKNDIRNHLPKSLFLPIDRGNLLKILSLQDSLADRAEDIAVLIRMKKLKLLDRFKEDFQTFLDKNLEAFNGARKIIREMHELLESSFGGIEAEKVRKMVEDVAFKEHEADTIQRKLLRHLLDAEDELSYTTFFLWQKIFSSIASISNLSENLAYEVRMTLEIK